MLKNVVLIHPGTGILELTTGALNNGLQQDVGARVGHGLQQDPECREIVGALRGVRGEFSTPLREVL